MAKDNKYTELPLFEEFTKWVTEKSLLTTGSFETYHSAFKTHVLSKDASGKHPLAELSYQDPDDFCKVYEYYLLCEEKLNIKVLNKKGKYRTPAQHGKALTLFQYYFEYLLCETEPKIALSSDKASDVLYLKNIIEALSDAKLDPKCILKHLTGISLSFKADTSLKENNKLSPYGIGFYLIRKILLIRWGSNQEKMCQDFSGELNRIAEYDLRNRIHAFGESLNKEWKNKEGYRGSGTQQIILGFISRKEIEDDGDGENDLFAEELGSGALWYNIARNLILLFIERINNDNPYFSPSYITEKDFCSRSDNDIYMLLALSPFQQTDVVDLVGIIKDPIKRVPGQAEAERRTMTEFAENLKQLISDGFLWIEHKNKNTQYLRVTPLPFKLSIHPASQKVSGLWNDNNYAFFCLLNKLLKETLSCQERLLKKADSTLADKSEFNNYAELQFILDSVPDSIAFPSSAEIHSRRTIDVRKLLEAAQNYIDSADNVKSRSKNWKVLLNAVEDLRNHEHQRLRTHLRMHETVELLVKVLIYCYVVHTLSKNPADIAFGYDSLHQLWNCFKNTVFWRWDIPVSSRILNRKSAQLEQADFHLAKASRLLEAIASEYDGADEETRQKEQAQWHRYLVAAESAMVDVRQGDYGEDCTLAIRSACLRIKSLILQKKIGGVTDHLTVVRNYTLPCLRELVFCQKMLFSSTEVKQTHAELIKTAIYAYKNEQFHVAGPDDLDSLDFNLVTTDGNAADQYATEVMALIDEYEKAITKKTKANQSPSPGGSLPTIWPELVGSKSTGRKFYQDWYLSGLDSVVVSEGDDAKDEAKRHMMRHLLEGQKIVLSSNQLLDSACIRELAHDSGFLWALKTGLISVSLYGEFDRLTDFAASLMERTYGTAGDKKAFKWSSLPDIDRKDKHREAIAAYLRDPHTKLKRSQVSSEVGEQAMQFIDAICILDEAIPHYHRNKHFQRGQTPNMMDLLGKRYQEIQHKFPGLIVLHNEIKAKIGNKAFRTDYLDFLELLRKSDSTTDGVRAGLDAKRIILDDSLINQAAFSVNDVYNTMLADRFAQMKEFIYTTDEQALIPYDETKRLSQGGCRKYGLIKDDTETGSSLDFVEVARLCIEISHILSRNPLATPEAIIKDLRLGSADPLSYTELEYLDGVVLRLENVATKVGNTVCKHKLSDHKNTDVAYTETK